MRRGPAFVFYKGCVIGDTAQSTQEVFISYATADKHWADAACAVLEANGSRCWIAPRDITPGTEWGAAIIAALDGCQIMVLIFSAHANESPQVRREIERAISKGLIVVPCRVEDVKPVGAMEYALSNTHWLDAFTPPVERQMNLLAQSVRALLPRDRGATEPPFVRNPAIFQSPPGAPVPVPPDPEKMTGDVRPNSGTRWGWPAGTPGTLAPPRRPPRRWLAAAFAGVCLTLGLLALVLSRTGKRDRQAGLAGPDATAAAVATDNKSAPPAEPVHAGSALRIRPLRVTHYATQGQEAVARGVVGEQSFSTRFGDAVTLTVELSGEGYLYLIGFNFNGQDQLLWPVDETGKPDQNKVPEPVTRLRYPAGDVRLYLEETDQGSGLQAYAAVASRRPLPAWRAWRKERRNLAWRALPAGETVWQADARASYPVLPNQGADRGSLKEALGVPPLAALCRALLEGGAEAVEAVAFPVRPKEDER